MSKQLQEQIARRRTFGIISHPDAGKTTLTQSIAQGLEVPEDQYVSSPSFALLHEYPGRIPLFHLDCYRLAGEEDVEGAGLADYIGGPGLTVIEWPDRGIIYDRHGAVLAANGADFQIGATPNMVTDPQELATALAPAPATPMLGVPNSLR